MKMSVLVPVTALLLRLLQNLGEGVSVPGS